MTTRNHLTLEYFPDEDPYYDCPETMLDDFGPDDIDDYFVYEPDYSGWYLRSLVPDPVYYEGSDSCDSGVSIPPISTPRD